MGLQFVETALLEIPKHGYYYSTRHETDRMQSPLEAVRVTQLLQEMQKQDAHDHNNSTNSNNGDRVQKLATLALEQVEQASHDQYESDDDDSFNQSVSTVPGTLPLKRASFMSLSEEMALEKALYLSGLEAVVADSVLDLGMDEYQ
jgi:hypothetical protein